MSKQDKQEEQERLNRTFGALSDPVRRSIMERLTQGELTVSELGRPFDISAPAISRHLRVLEECDLIRRELNGRTHVIRLNREPIAHLNEYMKYFAEFWRGGLDRFSRRLREESSGAESPGRTRTGAKSKKKKKSGRDV